MATAPPPPPPPPKSRGKQPRSIRPPPTPEFAAMPFLSDYSPPVQETSPPPEATHAEVQDAPQLPLQKWPPSPPSGQEDSLSDGEEKKHPVQETDPAQQMTEWQNEEANPPDQAGEDQPT